MKRATRENNILDHVHCNIKHAYRALPHPHLGQSTSHCTSHLPIPFSVRNPGLPQRILLPCLRTSYPNYKTVSQPGVCLRTRTLRSTHRLNWDVSVKKKTRIVPNSKPWMTGSGSSSKTAILPSGQVTKNSTHSQGKHEECIKAAKAMYERKKEGNFRHNGPQQQVWQGTQQTTKAAKLHVYTLMPH